MTQHIGIAGCSAEGAALCYKTICIEGEEFLGEFGHPELTMHTPPLSDYMNCIHDDDWEGVAEIMLNSAVQLEKAGADFVICPDNTVHQAMEFFDDRSPLPWLHIADAVADEAVRCGYCRLGITGTHWLVESEVYPEKLTAMGISFLRPDSDDREEMNRIIMNELIYGVFNPEAIRFFQQLMEWMKAEGCDAVVLGCTEIPLIMNNSNSPLPVLDSTRLLARAALRTACNAYED